MVTLNLTIVVEVVLFLVFLWAMKIFVFTPLLKVMDDRDVRIDTNREKAQTEAAGAKKLEREYASKVAAIHRESSHRIVEAHREAQAAHSDRVAALKQQEEKELADVHAEAMRQVQAEREHYPELTASLAEAVAKRLALGGDGP